MRCPPGYDPETWTPCDDDTCCAPGPCYTCGGAGGWPTDATRHDDEEKHRDER